MRQETEEKKEPTLSDLSEVFRLGLDSIRDVLKDMHNSLTIIERKLTEK
jgi:hypothetical protein